MRKYSWIWAIIKLNWANMVTNRKAFVTMAIVMCIQNLMYFGLWAIVFSRISSLHGWGLRDVAFLYSSGALGFGLIFTVCGGMNKLSQTIHSGALDTHLARPRPALLLALLERMRADSLGDVVTGIVMLTLFVRIPLANLPLLTALSLSAGLVFASFRLLIHTLAFWGASEDTPEGIYTSFLIAATNPQKGFNPWMKFILLTVFPAGYIGFLPVEIIRHFRWDYFALQVGSSAFLFGLSLWFFSYGLKRYTSGNKFLLLR